MESTIPPSSTAPNGGIGALIKETSTAEFQTDVIEESMNQPVLVDFWAPWCGPCRQLGPAIEKAVTSHAGKVKLVKINVDENQALAGQMGVQSIPAVFAYSGGKPVDGFTGALPASEINKFVQKQLDAAGPRPDSPEAQIAEALAAADEAFTAADYNGAAQIYQTVLDYQPDNDAALIGMAKTLLHTATMADAETTLSLVSEDGQASDAFQPVSKAIQLAREAESLGDTDELEAKVNTAPEDNQARFDLALALNAKGERLTAAEHLVTILRRDRDWNEDAARKKLLELFEVWGPREPATLKGRRLLSAALFA